MTWKTIWSYNGTYNFIPLRNVQQENNKIVRLCPFLWTTTIVVVHFARVSPWLFTIHVTKPFLGCVHLLLKCWSRTEATHLSPKLILHTINHLHTLKEVTFTQSIFAHIAKCAYLHYMASPTNFKAKFSGCLYHEN